MRTWRRPGWLHRRIAATNQTKARTRRLAQNLIYVTIDLYLFGVFFTIFVVLKKNLCDQAFRDEFVDGGTNGYDIVGWAEPQRACDYAVEGYIVYHSPRCLAGFSKKKGGFSILLRGQALNFGPTRMMCRRRRSAFFSPTVVSLD